MYPPPVQALVVSTEQISPCKGYHASCSALQETGHIESLSECVSDVSVIGTYCMGIGLDKVVAIVWYSR